MMYRSSIPSSTPNTQLTVHRHGTSSETSEQISTLHVVESGVDHHSLTLFKLRLYSPFCYTHWHIMLRSLALGVLALASIIDASPPLSISLETGWSAPPLFLEIM